MLTGFKCNLTSVYHPQSSGLDERFKQTLQHQLLKFVDREQDGWDLYLDSILVSYRVFLDSILFSYRVSSHDSTRYSPFYLIYGRQGQLRVQFNIKPNKQAAINDGGIEDDQNGKDEDETENNVDNDDRKSIVNQIDFEQHVSKLVSIRKKVHENIVIAQQ